MFPFLTKTMKRKKNCIVTDFKIKEDYFSLFLSAASTMFPCFGNWFFFFCLLSQSEKNETHLHWRKLCVSTSVHGKMEIFSVGNIGFDCIRKLNLVHLFVINHRRDLLGFGLCSVHNRRVGGFGRTIIWIFTRDSASTLCIPMWKSSEWIERHQRNEWQWNFVQPVLWLNPIPMTITICNLTEFPGSQLPPNPAKRFQPQLEAAGSGWKEDFPHQKFFFSYLNLLSKTAF